MGNGSSSDIGQASKLKGLQLTGQFITTSCDPSPAAYGEIFPNPERDAQRERERRKVLEMCYDRQERMREKEKMDQEIEKEKQREVKELNKLAQLTTAAMSQARNKINDPSSPTPYVVRVWDSETGILQAVLPSPNRLPLLAFTPLCEADPEKPPSNRALVQVSPNFTVTLRSTNIPLIHCHP